MLVYSIPVVHFSWDIRRMTFGYLTQDIVCLLPGRVVEERVPSLRATERPKEGKDFPDAVIQYAGLGDVMWHSQLEIAPVVQPHGLDLLLCFFALALRPAQLLP